MLSPHPVLFPDPETGSRLEDELAEGNPIVGGVR